MTKISTWERELEEIIHTQQWWKLRLLIDKIIKSKDQQMREIIESVPITEGLDSIVLTKWRAEQLKKLL